MTYMYVYVFLIIFCFCIILVYKLKCVHVYVRVCLYSCVYNIEKHIMAMSFKCVNLYMLPSLFLYLLLEKHVFYVQYVNT